MIGIYTPSYNRADSIITGLTIPETTYVVRQSQEDIYRKAIKNKVWAIEDSEINSWSNVMNYIVANAPEQLIAIIDDDISSFRYISDSSYHIDQHEIIVAEIERNLQIMDDLDIGFGALMFDSDPKKYESPYKFAGTLGAVYFFNRNKVVGKFHNEASSVADAEFELQELHINRIVLLPKYFSPVAKLNKGNNTQSRSFQSIQDSCMWTKLRWGKYFDYDQTKRKTKIKVDR